MQQRLRVRTTAVRAIACASRVVQTCALFHRRAAGERRDRPAAPQRPGGHEHRGLPEPARPGTRRGDGRSSATPRMRRAFRRSHADRVIRALVDAAALRAIGAMAAPRRAGAAVARAARTRLASTANAIAADRAAGAVVGRRRLGTGRVAGEVSAVAGRVGRTGRMIVEIARGVSDQLRAHRTAVAATSRPLTRGSVAGERYRRLRVWCPASRLGRIDRGGRRPLPAVAIVDDRTRSEHCDDDDDQWFHRSSSVMKQCGCHDAVRARSHRRASDAHPDGSAQASARAMPARQAAGSAAAD